MRSRNPAGLCAGRMNGRKDMLMKLYEIDQAIEACIDEETGEIVDLESLEALLMERDAKIENVALWVKNLRAEADALKKEKMAFADRQKVCENKIRSLEQFLTRATGEQPFKTDRVDIRYRKSEAVVLDPGADLSKLPDDLLKVDIGLNKTAMKQALKNGAEFDGIYLESRNNIQIK